MNFRHYFSFNAFSFNILFHFPHCSTITLFFFFIVIFFSISIFHYFFQGIFHALWSLSKRIILRKYSDNSSVFILPHFESSIPRCCTIMKHFQQKICSRKIHGDKGGKCLRKFLFFPIRVVNTKQSHKINYYRWHHTFEYFLSSQHCDKFSFLFPFSHHCIQFCLMMLSKSIRSAEIFYSIYTRKGWKEISDNVKR